ncbi:SDR family oxidoreductase (plasmid) [Rhodococcus sp. USK10]|uniref:SDR family NAD(P)-dependent oxidoreductase n=1 Tax=Rhodococcus sp. USK10 TaxID=2789739 RepID=UPI001C5FC40C|nr:SDR family NAD(P)-dependent oxidoreductase [Rhodococcus sp. USK10]QYB00275.1 SDR family oxidoreductase [Rhodococcus sp. USK10]
MTESPTRSAVVVGGASGIGAEISRSLAAHGYAITIADRDLAGSEGLADEIGGDARAARVDVTDEASVAAALTDARDRADRLDLVVNCAGVNVLGLVTDLPVEKFRRVLDVCLTGAFVVIKHAGRTLSPGGSVISLTSLNARQPGVGMSAYCSAKAGLSMLTGVAALELGASDIRVNAIAPGLVRTPLTSAALDVPGVEREYLDNIPLGRPGTTDEIAEAVLYLAGARWLTGEVLDLNGGAHLMRGANVHAQFEKAGNSV